MMSNVPTRNLMTPVKLIVGAIVILCLIIVFFMMYFTVAQYERGMVTTWGKASYVADPGLHFKMPFAQSVTYFRTDIQSLSVKPGVNTYTVDNQEIDVIFTVFYRLPPANIEYVYQNAQDYRERLFNVTVDRLKSEMGKINATHVAEQRAAIREKIKLAVADGVRVLGIEVTDFQLTDLEYTKSFRTAVEAAATAKAGIETQENLKQQASRMAEKARIDAEGIAAGVREKAKGDADATLLNATAEAKAIQMKGEAQAKAIRAQAEALQQNAKLVELRKVEQWDGKMPVQMLGNVMPFMRFDAPVPTAAEK